MTTGAIDLADIQGDILQAYGNRYCYTSYMFVGVADAERGRAWIRDHLDRITTAARWDGPGPDSTFNLALIHARQGEDGRAASTFNLALPHAGLVALGVPTAVIQTFSDEFCHGMAGRADDLGDLGRNAPARWDDGLGTGSAHVLVTINALTPEAL